MTGRTDLINANWTKSSFSSGGDNCVEVAIAGSVTGVRDSKVEQGGELAVTAAAFMAFLDGVKFDWLGRHAS